MSDQPPYARGTDSEDTLIQQVVKGEVSLHDLDRSLPPTQAAAARRRAVESITSSSFNQLALTLNTDVALSSRSENVIGAVATPVGVIGPLLVRGKSADGSFYVPMATTERTVVASAARGAKAITRSGGSVSIVTHDGMTRAPLFCCQSVRDAKRLAKWTKKHMTELQEVASGSSRYTRLVKIRSFIAGNNLWLRCVFKTGDAMGMNMATLASERVANYVIDKNPDVRLVALSGNLCSDKKESAINNLFGRGKSVIAEAIIDSTTLKEVLHSTASAICEVNTRKNLLGSAIAGSSKFNAHYANIVAAIFLATGQDIAEVVESSSGYTWAEQRDEDLYISVTLPCLEIGTVGGGTQLGAQAEALAMMGLGNVNDRAGKQALRFAEITGAAVLAGELGLLAVISTNTLGSSTRCFNQ